MKKILNRIFIIVTICFIVLARPAESNAQQATLMSLATGDTLSTSSSLDTVSKVINTTAGYSALGIQVKFTKISGTIDAKAYLYSSLDGTTYTLTDSSSAFANAAGAQAAFFTKTTTPYTYYKVQVRTDDGANTTQAAQVRVYYVLRKHD